MSDTATAWRKASPNGPGAGDKPEPGLYDAEVTSAKLQHRNRDGQPFIVLGYRAMSGGWQGHEWEEITSVQESTFGLLKGILSGLGRDPEAVDPDALEQSLLAELQAAVGAYVTVQVTQRGEYRNTMPQGIATPVASSDLGDDQGADFANAPAGNDDGDPIPF